MRFFVECAFPHLGKRGATSWKSAFCHLRLTEKRTLQPTSHGKPHSAIPRSRKLRFSVTPRLQNASFRDVAAPGRCRTTPPPGCGALWETAQLGKRARATPRQPAGRLCARVRRSRFGAWPHGKVHSGLIDSRKGALCPTGGFRMRLSVTSRRPGGVGQPPASLRGGLRQVAETGTTTSVTAPVRRTPLHARSNRAVSFKLPLRESRL